MKPARSSPPAPRRWLPGGPEPCRQGLSEAVGFTTGEPWRRRRMRSWNVVVLHSWFWHHGNVAVTIVVVTTPVAPLACVIEFTLGGAGFPVNGVKTTSTQ